MTGAQNTVPVDSIYKSPPPYDVMIGKYGHDIKRVSSGGYIVAGYIKYQGKQYRDHDAYLLRVDEEGNEIWHQTFGGWSSDRLYGVTEVSEDHFIVIGETYSFGQGSYDAWVIEVDVNGAPVWHQTFGGPQVDRGYGVTGNTREDITFTGFSTNAQNNSEDFYYVNLNLLYSQWQLGYFGTGKMERGYDIIETTDKGYLIVGDAISPDRNDMDIWVVKTDSSGRMEWNKYLGGKKRDRGKAVAQLANGDYVIIGNTYSFGTRRKNLMVTRLDPSGEVMWRSIHGDSLSDSGNDVVVSTLNGEEVIAITGKTNSKGQGYQDVWFVLISGTGEIISEQVFGGYTSDYGLAIEATTDNGYILSNFSKSTGLHETDLWLIKVNGRGEMVWEKVY